MLAIKRLAGVAPEVNLREHRRHTPLPSANKAAHSGFETQKMSSEVQNRGISGPIKGHGSTKIFLKNQNLYFYGYLYTVFKLLHANIHFVVAVDRQSIEATGYQRRIEYN